MKSIIKNFFLLTISIFILGSCSDTINVKSLLQEMPDRYGLSYYPDKEFKLKQASSYNRKTVGIEEDGWYENSDMSHFIRVEETEGRREFVMFDNDGPGAIVRWWMTFWKAENGTLRIYLDNNPVPEIEGAPFDIISGQFIAREPFSQSLPADAPLNERGHNLYFPIPYSQHCKVTYECDSLIVKEHYWWPDVFYNICYREYAKDVKVETFSLAGLKEIQSEIDEAAKNLLKEFSSSQIGETFDSEVLPGKSVEFTFNNKNEAIDFLSLQIESKNQPQALHSTVLSISFDGKQSVWVPAGEFFGTGYKELPHKTWVNQNTGDGLMTAAWLMPFQEKCTVTYINYGDEPIRLKGKVGLTNYNWRPNSMYFAACWHEYYHLNTRGEDGWMFDLNYANINGKGLYIGDQITLFNMAQTWWGEGDEKIFVDGETFPSSIGTGSEDYYGYAFGHPEPFSHPFISQPSGAGNFVPELTIKMRHRSLDAIPFKTSISSNIEMWHWASTCINYAMTTYFYIQAPYELNVKPDIEAVKKKIATSEADFYDTDDECYSIEKINSSNNE